MNSKCPYYDSILGTCNLFFVLKDEFEVYELIDKVNKFCQEHQNVSDVQFVCNDGLYTAFLKIS